MPRGISNIEHGMSKFEVKAAGGGGRDAPGAAASKGAGAEAPSRGESQKRPRSYDLQRRLIDFAVVVLDVVESLPNSAAGSHVGGQLTRCGTSPAANYGEAQAAESRKDFVHKMKVCLKELRESWVWLEIIRRKGLSRNVSRVAEGIREANELIAIFVTSVGTARANMGT
jgi:four helix bundle protein